MGEISLLIYMINQEFRAQEITYAQYLHEHELDAISAKALRETFKDFCQDN